MQKKKKLFHVNKNISFHKNLHSVLSEIRSDNIYLYFTAVMWNQ